MSTPQINPPSFRIGFESQIAKMPPEHQHVMRSIFNALTDIYSAFPLLKSQIDSKQTASTSPSTSSSSSSSSSTGVTPAQAASIATSTIQSTLGATDNQTGASYTLANSDYGGIVTLDNASPVAVTLGGDSTGINEQWWSFIQNNGVGTATLTPASGTINGAATLTLATGQSAAVFFDGTNWFAATSVDSSGSGVTSLNSLTGTLAILAGTGISVTPSGSDITIAATGAAYIKGNVSIGPEGGAGTYTASGTVTGATVGSAVLVGVSNSTEAGIFSNLIGYVATANTVTIQVTANASFLLTSLPVVVFV